MFLLLSAIFKKRWYTSSNSSFEITPTVSAGIATAGIPKVYEWQLFCPEPGSADELKSEGIARELINRVQNLRKDSGLEVTDKIEITIDTTQLIQNAIQTNKEYVCNEVLATDVKFGSVGSNALVTDLIEAEDAKIELIKQ